MKRFHLLLIATAFGMLLNGCVVRARGGVYADYQQPEMVYVSPGVQVVYDYNEPVFYSEGFYWRWYGGVWYRSNYHNYGWVRVRTVPTYVARIDNPRYYVHYRGNGRGGAVVRDHRDNRRYVAPPPARRNERVPANRGNNERVPANRGNDRDHRDRNPPKADANKRDHRN
ncbi:MAG TPA: hypothetical protein VL172_13990 [Kofleriaceae bacterium]|jgi:hypothetical protein|nr:hypothetical protein [Kofleriaceae bacterium]